MDLQNQKSKKNILSILLIIFAILLALNLLIIGFFFAIVSHRDKYSDWRSEAYRLGPWERSGTVWETYDEDIMIKSIRNQKTSGTEVVPYVLYDGEWHELCGFGIVTGLKKAELWSGDNSIRIKGDIEVSEGGLTLKNCENLGSIDILNGRDELTFKSRLADGASENNPAVSEDALSSNTNPAPTAATDSSEETTDPTATDISDVNSIAELKSKYWSDFYSDLESRPEGKEVTIFADNTFDCDYSGYKEIGYDFDNLHYSVMVPKDWSGFRFYPYCWCNGQQFENMLTGIPIYNGPLPVKIDPIKDDYSDHFANMPMEKSIFYFAQSPWQQPYWIGDEYIAKHDHETYIDKSGRSMQVYFLDGLPKFAYYDDFFSLCFCSIWKVKNRYRQL